MFDKLINMLLYKKEFETLFETFPRLDLIGSEKLIL